MSGAAISPSRILRDLDDLWRTLGKGEDGESGAAVLRACAMTLIVATSDPDEEFGETLAQLMRDHPSRQIILRMVEGSAPVLEAGVTAQCWMPFGKRQQICCEQIVITASRASLVEAPPVVRALVVPDLPVACWVRGRDLHLWSEFEPLLPLIDKLIVDSGGVEDVAGQVRFIRKWDEGPRRVADLAWTRLTRWRQAIAQLFDDAACIGKIREIESIRIGYEGDHMPISAYYLAAWLENAIGRKLHFSFPRTGPSDRARVQTVALSGGSVNYSITVNSNRDVELHAAARHAHTLFPRRSEYELLCEELSILGPDPVFEGVLRSVTDFIEAGH